MPVVISLLYKVTNCINDTTSDHRYNITVSMPCKNFKTLFKLTISKIQEKVYFFKSLLY